MQLPTTLTFSQMINRWASILNPLLANILTQGQQLQNISLVSGGNAVNHKLQRRLLGWFIVRRRQFLVASVATAYEIYDTQDSNSTPGATLNLTCSQGTSTNPVVVDLWVF